MKQHCWSRILVSSNIFKRPELLIEAVGLIAKRRQVRLLLAGYRVKAYFPNGAVLDFVDIVENPDDDDFSP
jgi:hypothetical protein